MAYYVQRVGRYGPKFCEVENKEADVYNYLKYLRDRYEKSIEIRELIEKEGFAGYEGLEFKTLESVLIEGSISLKNLFENGEGNGLFSKENMDKFEALKENNLVSEEKWFENSNSGKICTLFEYSKMYDIFETGGEYFKVIRDLRGDDRKKPIILLPSEIEFKEGEESRKIDVSELISSGNHDKILEFEKALSQMDDSGKELGYENDDVVKLLAGIIENNGCLYDFDGKSFEEKSY